MDVGSGAQRSCDQKSDGTIREADVSFMILLTLKVKNTIQMCNTILNFGTNPNSGSNQIRNKNQFKFLVFLVNNTCDVLL